MQPYQKKYQAEHMSLDVPPKGKLKRAIEGSNRMRARQEVYYEIQNLDSSAKIEENEDLNEG